VALGSAFFCLRSRGDNAIPEAWHVYAMEGVMRPAQKGKDATIAALKEAARTPVAFDVALAIGLVACVLLVVLFV
jgi:hypothetical protein